MKRLLLLLLLLFPLGASAQEWVLTTGGTLYDVESIGGGAALALVARDADGMHRQIIPATAGEEIDRDAHLLFDRHTETLIVIWNRDGAIVVTTRNAGGEWSDETVVAAAGSTPRNGLRATLTSSRATLFLHAAWWNGDVEEHLSASYALAAFEGGAIVSSTAMMVDELVPGPAVAENGEVPEDALPLLAIAQNGADSVDLVYGSQISPAATRVRITPKYQAEAKIWVPVGKQNGVVARPSLDVASTSNVELLVSGGRMIAYVPGAKFRYAVFDGQSWGAQHMLLLGGELTTREIVHELERTLASEDPLRTPADAE